jgi:hypothetical protein
VTYHLLRLIRCKTYVLFRICISVPLAGDRVAEIGVEQIIEMVHGRGEFHVTNSEPRALKYRDAVPLIVVFTKYDTLVTEIIFEGDLDESTEQGWQNAEREADKEFGKLCVGPFTKAINEVLNKKVPNANLSVPIKKVSGRFMSLFDISCTDDDRSLRYLRSAEIRQYHRGADTGHRQRNTAANERSPAYRTTLLKLCHCSTSEH